MDIGAQLFFYSFLVVILIVPWLLARDSAVRARSIAADGPLDANATGFFSSERERHLWLWVLVVLVAIYSTLSPAQQLAAELRERNLLTLTSGLFLLLVGFLIVVRWAKTGPGRREPRWRSCCWAGSTRAFRDSCPTGCTTWSTSA